MAETGAGTGEPGKSGSGAPEGGPPEGGSENEDRDDDVVPVKRFKAALATQKQHHDREMSALRAEFEAFKAGAGSKKSEEPQQPKRFSRAELKSAVDAGQITQEQADEQWAKQLSDETLERATSAALEVVDRKAKKERIDSDVSAYKRLKPEIMEQGSETRQKISEEYQYLVSIGQPKTVETELAAIRAVLGPLDRLEKAAGARRSTETHQEGGSGGDGGKKQGSGGSKKLVDTLSSREKEYYEKGIKAGRYKDWTDVEAELKYANPALRAKMGAKV